MRHSDDARWQPGNFEMNTEAVRRLGTLATAIGDILPHGGFGARYHEDHDQYDVLPGGALGDRTLNQWV